VIVLAAALITAGLVTVGVGLFALANAIELQKEPQL